MKFRVFEVATPEPAAFITLGLVSACGSCVDQSRQHLARKQLSLQSAVDACSVPGKAVAAAASAGLSAP